MAVTDINLPPQQAEPSDAVINSLLWQAYAALQSCDAQHPQDGGRQWHDEKAVEDAIKALTAVLAAPPPPAPQQAKPTRGDWDRFHHVMHKHGLHPGRTDDDLIDLLDRALSEVSPPAPQQAEQQWIAWNEQQPRDEQVVLVTWAESACPDWALAIMCEGRFIDYIEGCPWAVHPTHWMPLPAAPGKGDA